MIYSIKLSVLLPSRCKKSKAHVEDRLLLEQREKGTCLFLRKIASNAFCADHTV